MVELVQVWEVAPAKREWEQGSLVYMEPSTNNACIHLPKSCDALEVCWELVGLLY